MGGYADSYTDNQLHQQGPSIRAKERLSGSHLVFVGWLFIAQ